MSSSKNDTKTNVSRAANSSILGYEFQMLMSVQKLLKTYLEDRTRTVVVEGQEDLDVHGKTTELCQYKYYSGEISKSRIQAAVAYLFEFWRQHKTDDFSYHLFLHGNFDFNQNTEDLVSEVLNFSKAKCILSSPVGIGEVKEFTKKFSIKCVESYKNEKKETVKLLQEIFGLSSLSSEFLIYPWAMQHIHELAIRKDVEMRKEVVKDFVERLRVIKTISNNSLYQDIKNEKNQRNAFVDIMKDRFHYKSREFNYILEFGERWDSTDIIGIMNELIPLFAYSGNRVVNRPLTFVLDCTKEDMWSVKTKLLRKLSRREGSLIMNDGFENFKFDKSYFCSKPLRRESVNRTKYKELAFNFRLVTRDTFVSEQIGLSLKDIFVIDFDSDIQNDDLDESLRMESFNSNSVIACVGGLKRL